MGITTPRPYSLLGLESLLPSTEETRPKSLFYPQCQFSWIAPSITQQEPLVTAFWPSLGASVLKLFIDNVLKELRAHRAAPGL